MKIDITSFKLINVIDTCSIWNLLSSDKLYMLSKEKGCYFCFTKFVEYECLFKRRKSAKETEIILVEKLKTEISRKNFQPYPISIEDLQNIEVLKAQKNLSKGELSSIVFAKKTNQAFITDDQKARILSELVIGLENTQTIPQLFGWLVYSGVILDTDKKIIINQHIAAERILGKFFEAMFLKALEIRLMSKGE
jgi:predicted nucleic acid-binding protein